MDSHQYINQDSGIVEYYTPADIIELARRTMGTIDLDPASSPIANQRVKAARYFTIADDGLSQAWHGNVWMNHPYGDAEKACKVNCTKKRCKKRGHCIAADNPGNAGWIDKLVGEHRSGRATQACCIVHASTSEAWFQPLYDFPICFSDHRIRFLRPDGTPADSPTKGSAIVYLGPNVDRFVAEIWPLGRVMLPAVTR